MQHDAGPSISPRDLNVPPNPVPVVFIVEDDVTLRESLQDLIRYSGWQPKAFSFAEEFLRHPHIECPSCLLLDVSLPDLSGLDVQRKVADRTTMPIIFITGYGDIPTTVQAMRAGAFEFLTKPFVGDVLVAAIWRAIEHSHSLIGRQSHLHALQDRYDTLTPRERAVMRCVLGGCLNKQIAFELGICEMTVKVHRSNMMRKMQAKSVPELVKMAIALRREAEIPPYL
jgi:FixJ family two-component response regulator